MTFWGGGMPWETRGESTRLEALGSAAAGIAHDINNELTLVLNHLSLTDVASARAAAARCSALTASLLAYCRGQDLRLSPIDPVRFVWDFVQGLALPDSVELSVDVPSTLPKIRADRSALTRVMSNLVSNARHAIADSGKITIRASELAITVQDSGPGIAPGLTKKIFEPFFSTKGTEGTGLGLAIARDLMRQQGGSIAVHSEPGQGACFALRFRN